MDRVPAARFEDLVVWQKSHRLTLEVYRLTKTFPKEELFGLTSQMRRAAISVSANIAEGFAKKGKPDKARILNIAQASLEELRYYFILSKDLQYLKAEAAPLAEVDEVARLLGAYIRGITSHSSSQLPAPSSQLPAPSS
ncbi:MAG TPA: four helix bundle protein [Vicinamibacterales bacterium]|nr:four helix bundle protein [Vicinamibacterales bacterium]